MGADPATLAFYDREAPAYAGYSVDFADDGWLERFADGLAEGARVLDFGCGSAWAADWFARKGFAADALDGSAGLAGEAAKRYGLDVRVCQFEDFTDRDRYDGIWASFCLLHDSRDAMPGHLARLNAALKPGGRLYLGLKAGAGERRDSLGRRYTYYAHDEIEALLARAGFERIDATVLASQGYDGGDEKVLHIFAERSVDA